MIRTPMRRPCGGGARPHRSHAGTAIQATRSDVQFPEDADHHVFEARHVGGRVGHPRRGGQDVDDGVADELTRAVVRDVATAIRGRDLAPSRVISPASRSRCSAGFGR
ncbi:MAG: hypothetical protein R2695_03220 [Acidimicrobiales bacterium]